MKDFDAWNGKKKSIETFQKVIRFHEREIWWISLGVNIGVETDGKHGAFERPALVLRKFNRDMAWILPTTSKVKDSRFYDFCVINDEKYSVSLTQIRTISSKRFLRKEGMASKEDFSRIKTRIAGLLITKEDPQNADLQSRRPKP